MTTLSNAIGPFCSAWLGWTCCKIALLILTSGFGLNSHLHHLHCWRATKGRDNENDNVAFESMIPGLWWQCAIPNSGVHHRDDRQHHHHLLHFWIPRQTLSLSKQDEVKNWKLKANRKYRRDKHTFHLEKVAFEAIFRPGERFSGFSRSRWTWSI